MKKSIVSMIEAMPKIQNDHLSDYLKFLETNRLFFIDEIRIWLNLLLKEDISMSKFVENFNVKLFNQYIESEKAKDERIKELEEGLKELIRCNPVFKDNLLSSDVTFKEFTNALEKAKQLLTKTK